VKFGKNMSKIGKKPIIIPEGVEVEILENSVKVKGPKGELSQEVPEEISVRKEEGKIVVSPKRRTRRSAAFWGLIRSLLQNCVTGVSEGFEKKLELRGIGYKAALEGERTLRLEVGFSHPVKVEIPPELKVSVEKNIITISGIDKQKVGEFAAKVRKIRPPEPYKGKGIRYLGEKVRMKEGKKAAGTAG
jgi:large subunit ribosomal protein L6